MPRDIPLGNGRLLVTFDHAWRMRDLYYPHVGLENHLMGRRCRIGVAADGAFAWIGSAGWKLRLLYEPDALVSDVRATNEEHGIEIACSDAVDFEQPLLVRHFRVRSLRDRARRVRIVFHHDLDIMETDAGDTAYFDPRLRGVIHYKRRRYFLLNAMQGAEHGILEYSTGRKRAFDDEGTTDPGGEAGRLDQNAIAHGAVDSLFSVTLDVPASGEEAFWTWLVAGERYQDVARSQAALLAGRPEAVLRQSRAVSRTWARKESVPLDVLAPEVAALFTRSLLVIGTQCDHDGGIVAANDTDIMRFARDTYSYVWPRDGALVARALDRTGHHQTARRFFSFCVEHVSSHGYFFQKYNTDGSLASSWHPWVRDGKEQIPIQEDETALVLWALAAHLGGQPDAKFLVPAYSRFVRPAGDFLYEFRDADTGLPLPSWDLWEERFGVHAFTVASVHAGLLGAAALADLVGEDEAAARWRTGAAEVLAGLQRYLYHDDLGRYVRMGVRENGGYWHDVTVDAALCGLFLFDVLPLDDARLLRTIDAVEKRLWVDTPIGGMARYENDYYHQVSSDLARIPGNPWFVCTLWLAEWHALRATSAADLEATFRYLDWARARARPSGVMAEQVHPETGEPVSVAPLTWSHAAYVSAVATLARKLVQLKNAPEGLSV
jgi:GH15 family glucan-1,4-alpha-glucosidase